MDDYDKAEAAVVKMISTLPEELKLRALDRARSLFHFVGIPLGKVDAYVLINDAKVPVLASSLPDMAYSVGPGDGE